MPNVPRMPRMPDAPPDSHKIPFPTSLDLASCGAILGKVWNEYRASVLPDDASLVQLIESRRAFYAGAMGLLTEMTALADPESGVTEADMARMEVVDDELRQFAEDVRAGKA